MIQEHIAWGCSHCLRRPQEIIGGHILQDGVGTHIGPDQDSLTQQREGESLDEWAFGENSTFFSTSIRHVSWFIPLPS